MGRNFSRNPAANDFKIHHEFRNLQGCTNTGPLVAQKTKYFTVEPNNCRSLSMEFASCASSGTYSFEVASIYLQKVCTSVP
jgi:hypothetical protein